MAFILLLTLIFICPVAIFGQKGDENSKKTDRFSSRLFFGGGFGLQFGNLTLIEISPMVGYKVTPKLGFGISPTYKYYNFTDSFNPANDFKTSVYGGSIFSRYLILENVFAHAEYETLYFNTKLAGGGIYPTQFNSLLVGGGYRQMIGSNSSLNLMVLWNLNDTPDSPYTNPVIRMGLSVGM